MPIYVGTQKIDVSGMDKVYVGTQLVYQKIIPNILSSITLSGQTTSRNRGQSFVFGGTVTAHYTNGNTANVTSSTTFSGYNMNTAGTYTVTASYTENGITKTATYSLTVNKAWTALWSGSKSISWSYIDTAPSTVDIYTNSSLPTTSDIRITFTMSNKVGDKSGYLANKTSLPSTGLSTSKPSSPYRISSFNKGTSLYWVGVAMTNTNTHTDSQLAKCWVYVYWNSSKSKFQLGAYKANSSGGYSPNSGSVSITVTKIERYY